MATLDREFAWLEQAIEARMKDYSEPPDENPMPPPPELLGDMSEYAKEVTAADLSSGERLTLLLALATELRPQLLDVFLIRNEALDRRFVEFGGVVSDDLGFVPTVRTAAFLVGGAQLSAQLRATRFVGEHHPLVARSLLWPERHDHESLFSTRLRISPEFISRLINENGDNGPSQTGSSAV